MSEASLRKLRIDRIDELVRDRVVTVIRDAIFNGDLPPGMRLVERELIEQTGVSRTSVREALRILQSEGLVEPVREGRGLQVTRLSKADVQHLYEVREPLESAVARLFVMHATDDEVDELARIGARLTRIASDDSSVDLRMKAVLEFDEHLRSGARNPVLAEMLGSISTRIHILRRLSIGAPGRGPASAAEYDAIIAAITRRSKRGAAAAAAAHVVAARSAALRMLEMRESD